MNLIIFQGSTRSLRGFLGSFGAMASTSDAPVSRSRVATDNSPPVEVEMTRKLTWTCPICLIEEDAGQTAGNGSDIINFSRENLPCSHVFHMCCLADLTRHTLKYKKPFSCPMCRKKFSVSLVKKTASEKRIHLYGNFWHHNRIIENSTKLCRWFDLKLFAANCERLFRNPAIRNDGR